MTNLFCPYTISFWLFDIIVTNLLCSYVILLRLFYKIIINLFYSYTIMLRLFYTVITNLFCSCMKSRKLYTIMKNLLCSYEISCALSYVGTWIFRYYRKELIYYKVYMFKRYINVWKIYIYIVYLLSILMTHNYSTQRKGLLKYWRQETMQQSLWQV